ncbi:MAG: nuclear transport factor 2 family protein, partial [Burkholderiales bacterium]|nr:nuclear transport factor 2 family protein [Burkholderiales bacterium]
MHPNAQLINEFYHAFQARDGFRIAACYHPNAEFSDPIFTSVKGKQVGAMWRMLTEVAADLEV